MRSATTRTEELFLKIFKVTVLTVMGIALLAIIGLLVYAVYQYTQTPIEPAPPKPAPVREIQMEDLKNFLIERNKTDDQKSQERRQAEGERSTSLRYLENATALFRCVEGFGKAVGVDVDRRSDFEKSQDLERLRSNVERASEASDLRGEAWIKSLLAFSCKALEDPQIIELRKDNKVKSVFYPMLEFHIRAWDSIQDAKVKFEQSEANRVTSERASEAARIATARARALTSLMAAAGLFATFMLLALYLIAAKVETNLRGINESIRSAIPSLTNSETAKAS